MFKQQERALKSLERALKMCKKANIVLYGCDYQLIAMDKRKHDKHINSEESRCSDGETIPDIERAVEELGGWAETVDTSDTYQDSGGA